jgi:hypothetical protein
MSIKHAADYIRSQGRNNDTQLMHVTPNELGGLQALAMAHGGSLTLNPTTGLPEADFLEAILPAIIGFGITAATGGAAAPWMVGAGVGAGTTAITGSLEKGLMAGLGAFGGAGLGGSVISAGAPVAAGTNAMAATGAGSAAEAATLLPPSGMSSAAGIGGTGAGSSIMPTAGQSFSAGLGEIASAPGQFLSNNLGNIGKSLAPALLETPEQSSPQETESYIQPYDYSQTVNPNFGMPGQSYYSDQTFTPRPQQSASSFTGFNNGGIASLAEGGEPKYTNPTKPINPAVTEYNNKLMQQANYEYNQSPQLGAFQSAIPGAGAYNEQAGIAYQADRAALAEKLKDVGPNQFGYQYNPETGMVDNIGVPVVEDTSRNNGISYGNMYDPWSMGNQADGPAGADGPPGADSPPGGKRGGQVRKMAEGGIANLGGYSDGGQLLRGPGDGVSDDIPASIEGRQPARLADGEFVFPARIVSEIGNGSTDAGAKRLYAMMDAIENRRKQSMKDIAADTQAYRELKV